MSKHRKAKFDGRIASGWRLLTAGARALPDFIILGGQRCGTSFLNYLLAQHPQVLPAVVKEVRFFDMRFAKGVRWYRSHFPLLLQMRWHKRLTSKPSVTGEATPLYLFHPHAPARLRQEVPSAKLIVLLRDPVARAYSHYMHNRVRKHRKSEPLSFEEAIRRESERLDGELDKMLSDEWYDSFAYRHYSYVQRGVYVDQLKAYERYFDLSQILVLKSEDFFTKTPESYAEVLRFLGLEPYVPKDMVVKNSRRHSKFHQDSDTLRETFDMLRNFFKPHNERLYRYLGRDMEW